MSLSPIATSVARFFLIVGATIVAVMASIAIAVWIGETVFFDRLHYRKTMTFGYSYEEGEPLNSRHQTLLTARIVDLMTVMDASAALQTSPSGQAVLGQTTDDGVYTIALIGDSFVYGTGVKEQTRVGTLLEKKLNALRPTKVYALAQPGDNIAEHYSKYVKAKQTLNPDLVIMTMVDNDLLLSDYDKYPPQLSLLESFKTACPQPPFTPDMNDPLIDWSEAAEKYYLPAFSEEYANHCYFGQIVHRITQESQVLFYNFYHYDDGNPQAPATAITTKHEALVTQNGGRVVAYDVIKNGWQPVSAKETHPSAQMHRRFAQQLFEEVTKVW